MPTIRPRNPQSLAITPADTDATFNPVGWLLRILRFRVTIAGIVAASMALGFLVYLMTTPLYVSTTRLEILPQGAKVVEDFQVTRETSDPRALLTARERVLSYPVARRVVHTLGLADQPAFLAPTPTFSVVNLVKRIFRVDLSSRPPTLTAADRERLAVEKVQGNMTVRPIVGTNILLILYSDTDRQRAARIADQIAMGYISERIDQASQTSQTARNFIEDQVAQVRVRLQKSEEDLAEYARSNQLQLTGDDSNLITTNTIELNKSLLQVEKDRIEQEGYARLLARGRVNDLPQVVENQTLNQLKVRVAELRGEYEMKLGELKPAFPEMKSLQARIAEADRQITRTTAAIAESIRLKYQELQAREQAMRGRLADLERQQAEFRDKNIRYTILKREVDANRSQYQSLINKMNEVGVSTEIRSPSAAVVDAAQIAPYPSQPRLSIHMLVSVLLGMLVSALTVYAIEVMTRHFSTPDQVEADLGVPVLGIVPRQSPEEIGKATADPSSALSEAYRSLRTSLQFAVPDNFHTLLVTSSEPSEGKSTTVYKLSHEFAALGRRVLVIDADMRKPSLHKLFGANHAIGLSNFLMSSHAADSEGGMFQATATPKVTFLSAGILPHSPADLLNSDNMAILLSRCSGYFDVVLIDAPPVIGLADAPILARMADATLLVVSTRQVSRSSARSSIARLNAVGANVVGAAMSKFTVDRFDYKYGYKYQNYNYYNYKAEHPAIEGLTSDGSSPSPRQPAATRMGRIRSSLRRYRNLVDKFGRAAR